MTEIAYPGDELSLFAQAHQWRAYWMRHIDEFISRNTVEIGAGLGSVTRLLSKSAATVTAVEPDPVLSESLEEMVRREHLSNVTVVKGTLSELPPSQLFDSIVYADVLEHIETDGDELRAAANRLQVGGYLVVLVPAHQWLYSPFDARIGHFRRYSKQQLKGLTPPNTRLMLLRYLDSAGLFASAANRVLLRSADPSPRQIRTWDRYFIPASRITDPLLGFRFGKSLIGVWQRLPDETEVSARGFEKP
jgi:2-polyprenyl-3-methyl-5-hydroxy-6-metoxy-1,4-benzoquinol methylase